MAGAAVMASRTYWTVGRIRGTGVEIDYRYKLESIDLWETVVITNNKSALPVIQATLAA